MEAHHAPPATATLASSPPTCATQDRRAGVQGTARPPAYVTGRRLPICACHWTRDERECLFNIILSHFQWFSPIPTPRFSLVLFSFSFHSYWLYLFPPAPIPRTASSILSDKLNSAKNSDVINKMLSYRRETALQGALQFSPKVEDWNWETIFYGIIGLSSTIVI